MGRKSATDDARIATASAATNPTTTAARGSRGESMVGTLPADQSQQSDAKGAPATSQQ